MASGYLTEFQTRDGGAVHVAGVGGVVGCGSVDDAGIVPHGEVVVAPLMGVDETIRGRVGEQPREEIVGRPVIGWRRAT